MVEILTVAVIYKRDITTTNNTKKHENLSTFMLFGKNTHNMKVGRPFKQTDIKNFRSMKK
jgi:hypothetical protein